MTSPDGHALPEYDTNLFISALPAVASQLEILKQLSFPPAFDTREQVYPATLRKHCVLRLSRMFLPMARQVALAEQIGMQIRQGYIGRNPSTGDYIRHLEDGAERVAESSMTAVSDPRVLSTATSMALAGCSGAGKSLTVELTLRTFPQLVRHETPFSLVQIVWLKLDCPTQGSPKQLCINFFEAVDRLLGTDYLKRYGGQGHAVEWMLVRMAQVASLHALGMLVVDEVQNLKRAAIGPDALLNFLVLLINTIGIPVLVIGTLGAIPLLQRNFRQARRGTGIGSAVWDRMPRGKDWDAFVTSLWKYQWTRELTPLTPEIREVLYDESQGIVDILVKLFMLAQFRVITVSEVRPKVRDVLTASLLRQVAREQLAIVRPMIDALRSNDLVAIRKFDDLVPLQMYLDDVIARALGDRSRVDPTSGGAGTDKPASPIDDVAAGVLSALTSNGVAADVASALLDELKATESATDPLALLMKAVERLQSRPPAKVRSKAPKPAPESPLPEQDLRRIVAEGGRAGLSGYEALLAAKVIGLPCFDSAA